MTLREAANSLAYEIAQRYGDHIATIGMSVSGPTNNLVEELYLYIIDRKASKQLKEQYDGEKFNGYPITAKYTGKFRPAFG